MRQKKFSRRSLLKSGAIATAAGALPLTGRSALGGGAGGTEAKVAEEDALEGMEGRGPLAFRALLVSLIHPYSPLSHGSKMFFDKATLEKTLRNIAACEYNAVVYFLGPWPEHCYQNSLLRYEFAPEARDYPLEQHEEIIEQATWIFQMAIPWA